LAPEKLMLVIVVACCAERTVPNLLSVLCSNDMTARQHLESQQALFHQFAKIIDFTLKFDDLKVNTCDLLTLPAKYVEQGLCSCRRPSACLSVPSGRRTPLLQVCCCGPGQQEMSIDCC